MWLVLSTVAWGSVAAQSTDRAYKLGPGDRIRITVFGESDLSMDVTVPDTGRLTYPFLGEINVEGMTVSELESTIVKGLKGPYLVNPIATVSIVEHRPFFVHGEVQEPGGIAYQPRLTVERAIALAGGFTWHASRKKIEVIRAGDETETAKPVKLSDPVFPGDIVIVGHGFF